MSIIETVIYIVGWSTMIGIFNYLEKEVSVSDVTPCKINDDCLHCCPSVRQQFTVLA